MIIYKTTNNVNGKIYIGQHCRDTDDGYLGSGTILKIALEKYGKDNFKRETVEHCTIDNIDEREMYWIAYYKSNTKAIGYNITDGGGGCKGLFGEKNPNFGNRWDDEQRQKRSDMLKGVKLSESHKEKIKQSMVDNNPFKGKTHTEEQKIKWSRDRKGTRLGEENTFYGKTHSEDSKKLIGASSKLRTKYIFHAIGPDGDEYTDIPNLQNFMNNNNLGRQNNLRYKENICKYKGWVITRRLKGDR